MRRRGRGYYPLKSEDQDESKEEIMMISKGNGRRPDFFQIFKFDKEFLISEF